MRHEFEKTIVMSLGGSIAFADGINAEFLREFRKLIESLTKKGKKFVIVVGGGGICRTYQRGAEEIAPITDEDKDWIGIYSTRLNASVVRSAFGKRAHPLLLEEPRKLKKLSRPVTLSGGWKPGWSTDFMATQLAADFGAKEVVNIGKPRFVYDKNPDAHKDAKPFEELRWKDYRGMVPKKWTPGFHAPVDPIAAKFSESKGMTMFVVGPSLENLASLLKGEEFEGTIIR
ncbi:MAG: UMP kinase [Candidatus Liptonbacteria bacterium]|nr:UMP kinase [Candidatus Liptonbacteria bacterium]